MQGKPRYHTLYAVLTTLLLGLLGQVTKGQVWTANQIPIAVNSQGRINAIAAHPWIESVAVGTESGGLYLSTNPRLYFRRVIGALPNDIRDVAWLRTTERIYPANVLLATTRHDFRLPNGGGLWRSTDSGETWIQVNLQSILSLPAANDLDGYAISQDRATDKVAVATSMGLVLTEDRGASWTVVNPFGPGGNAHCVAVSYKDGNLLVAGQDGVRWSTDAGVTWTATRTPLLGANADNYHGLTWGTKSGMAYYVDPVTSLSFTTDYGGTWKSIAVPPVQGGGGIRFVYETTHGSTLDLYLSDTFKVSRLRTRSDRRPEEINFAVGWTRISTPHDDPRCLAFTEDNWPYLMGTDGGLHTTTDHGSSWRANPVRGLEALQIYDVNGQWVGRGRDRRYDIYIGTQDNGLRATDEGWRWPYQFGAEGYFLQMRPDVPEGNPIITFIDPNFSASTAFNTAGRYFSDFASGRGAVTFVRSPDPLLNVWAIQPKMLPSGRLIQPISVGNDARIRFRSGLAVSDESERSWSQLTRFPEPWAGLPFVSQSGAQVRVFQPFSAGWDENLHRYRLLLLSVLTSTSDFATARPVYSAMSTSTTGELGSIGTTNFAFVWIPVLDVHPNDLNSVMAADIANGVVSQSSDGGNNWTALSSLTDLLLHSGAYRFATTDDVPFVTAISYCPMDPSRILVGCRSGGVYVSNDAGTSWRQVAYSDRMANVTSFHWKSNSEVFASTYGTGLWQLSVAVDVPIRAHAEQGASHQIANQSAQRPGNAGREVTGLTKPPFKGAEPLTFVGGHGDPRQPRYDWGERIQVRLTGLAPKSPKELDIFLDGKRMGARQFTLQPGLNELTIAGSVSRGGHILRVVWKQGQRQTETGGLFFAGTMDK